MERLQIAITESVFRKLPFISSSFAQPLFFFRAATFPNFYLLQFSLSSSLCVFPCLFIKLSLSLYIPVSIYSFLIPHHLSLCLAASFLYSRSLTLSHLSNYPALYVFLYLSHTLPATNFLFDLLFLTGI